MHCMKNLCNILRRLASVEYKWHSLITVANLYMHFSFGRGRRY